MYTALLIMLAGIVAGRLFGSGINAAFLRHAVMASIFLLLFLLGSSIGANERLLSELPRLGAQSLLLMLFCTGASILCAWIITPLYFRLARKKTALPGEK